MPRKYPPLPVVPPARRRDHRLWLWLTSRRFRQCWRSFGRRSLNHAYLRSNVVVVDFESQPLSEFIADYDAATREIHGFSGWLDRVQGVDTIFRIYLRCDRAPDDPDHWMERELYVFGHPASDEPIMYIESTVMM